MKLKNNPGTKSRPSAGDIVYKILVTAGILLFSLSFLFVLVWMFCNSIRPQKSYFNNVLAFWNLKGATFDNYVKIFTTKYSSAKITMFGMLKNSLVLIAVCTGLQAIVPVITGYVVARYKTGLGAIAVQLVIISMVVPAIGSTASTYAFMSAIKLKDKWLGIFLMNAGGLGFGMLLYKNYFSGIRRIGFSGRRWQSEGVLFDYVSAGSAAYRFDGYP